MPKIKIENKDTTATHARDSLSDMEARLHELQRAADEIKAKLQGVRGTRDLTATAAGAVAQVSLGAHVEAALRAAPHTIADLALALEVPAGRASSAVKTARAHLVNVGTEELPRWFWKGGDDAPAPALQTAVESLIRDRPMTFQELIAFTGARGNRVSGAIGTLHKSGRVSLMKVPDRAGLTRWFVMPEDAAPPKRAKP